MTNWNTGSRTRQLMRYDQRGLQAWARMEAQRKGRKYVIPYQERPHRYDRALLIRYIILLERCPFEYLPARPPSGK